MSNGLKTIKWNKFFLAMSLLMVFTNCEDSEKKITNTDSTTLKNVVFIIVDDLTKTLGTYGHPLVKTPNVDRLAGMGVQFENAYCNFAVCNPSRSSFLTGLLPQTTNILDNRKPIQSILGNKVTLPALFKENGFYTMGLGKIFHTPEEQHNDLKAWDEIHNFATTPVGKQGDQRNITDGALPWCQWQAAEGNDEDQIDGQTAQKAVAFIKNKKEQPFFLAIGFHKPHDPFIAPKKYFDMYPLDKCEPTKLPINWKAPYDHTLPGETQYFSKFTDLDKREFLRSYYACSSFMDAQVGKVINALEASDQMKNTLIVFFGDHGYHLGEHDWWNKVTLFEQGTSAPFIIVDPTVKHKGVQSIAMFEFIDIYPTMAELLQLDNVPNYLEGQSFAKIIRDPSMPFRSEVRAIINRNNMYGNSVKNKDWRYIVWDDGKQGHELYNQEKDPMEYNNLADDPAYTEVVKKMKKLLYINENGTEKKEILKSDVSLK